MYNYRANDYYNYVNNNYNLPNYSSQEEKRIYNPYQGFIRGNFFPDLYNYYKNDKPYNINPANEQAELLTNIDSYSFALNDLNLYLDIHPEDQNMIELYNQYVSQYKNLVNDYSRKYGSLEAFSINHDKNKWDWVDEPWPWQGGK